MSGKRIRLGMVGGGTGGFIGAVHRMAARLDDRFDLVAGAFSSDPERARQSAEAIGVDADRGYLSYEEMAAAECQRVDGIEAVAIVTPNHLHVPVALAFLKAGIHVICDKPLATSVDNALALEQALAESGRLFVLTHNYSGYPMIRHARELIAKGELGPIRVVQAEYAQDWLANDLERQGAKGAEWRTDPKRAGAGGAIGDIGTHAYQLMRFVTGLKVQSLQAQLTAFVPGRALDDDAEILLRFLGGARGSMWISQVAAGHANGLRLRVYGEKASIDWSQETPDQLRFCRLGEPPQILSRGGAGLGPAAAAVTRIPAGHPEGYLEAFACLYREAADAIAGFKDGKPAADTLPGLADGLEGLRFIEAAARSSAKGGTSETL